MLTQDTRKECFTVSMSCALCCFLCKRRRTPNFIPQDFTRFFSKFARLQGIYMESKIEIFLFVVFALCQAHENPKLCKEAGLEHFFNSRERVFYLQFSVPFHGGPNMPLFSFTALSWWKPSNIVHIWMGSQSEQLVHARCYHFIYLCQHALPLEHWKQWIASEILAFRFYQIPSLTCLASGPPLMLYFLTYNQCTAWLLSSTLWCCSFEDA